MKSNSVWLDTTAREQPPTLQSDLDVDVCVIGAGISGVTAAYLLSKAGQSVALLDDGEPGAGQTAMTSAHLTAVIDDRYSEMVRLHGEEGARLACDSHRSAIARIWASRCTHLGCVLGWNEAASTWDCPCHGSRYDALGHLINGPASQDMRKA